MAELLGDVYQGDSWNYPVRLVLGTASTDNALCCSVCLLPHTLTIESHAGDERHSNTAHKL